MKKRINLSYDLERKEDRKVYDFIQKQRGKTKYVIDAVLAYEDRSQSNNREELKKAVKEAITELGLDVKISEEKDNTIDNSKTEQNQIPDDVFNMISGL